MLLDRQYQNELLSMLLDEYPYYRTATPKCRTLLKQDQAKYEANVLYLQNHGLVIDGVSCQSMNSIGGKTLLINSSPYPRITEKGIDFMLNDGGLSAILNVQIIKLHDETIRAMLEAAIEKRELDEEERNAITSTLREISAEGLKTLLSRIVDLGIEKAPSLLPLIQSML